MDSTQTNRRKRVRVVQRVVPKTGQQNDGIPIMADTVRPNRAQPSPQKSSQIRANPLPRILLPERSRWHLPFYGPSLSEVRKIQLLPPIGPLPVLKDKSDLMSVFRPKPKPKLTHYLVENNDEIRNSFDIFEKRVAKTEVTPRPAVRADPKPKQTHKRNKKPKSVRSHSSNRNRTTLQTLKPVVETTTPTFIEINLSNNTSQSRGQARNAEHIKMKLMRNGKWIGQRDSKCQK